MTQQAIAQRQPSPVIQHNVSDIQIGARGVELRTFGDVLVFSEAIYKTGLAPKGVVNAQGVALMVQTGLELGLTPMQSLQGMNVINNKVGISGELALALIRSNLDCEYIHSRIDGTGDFMTGVCVSKRVGDSKEHVTEFSVTDAKKAGLWAKAGPWSMYPKRMLMFRAVGFHGKDYWSEVLKGIPQSDENQDVADSSEPSGFVAVGKILDVTMLREGALARARVTLHDGTVLTCNGQSLIALAKAAHASSAVVEIGYREGQHGKDIIAINNAATVVETEAKATPEQASVQEANFESDEEPTSEAAHAEESQEVQTTSPMNIGQLLTAFRQHGVMRPMVEAKWGKKVADMTEEDCAFLQGILDKIKNGASAEEFFGE